MSPNTYKLLFIDTSLLKKDFAFTVNISRFGFDPSLIFPLISTPPVILIIPSICAFPPTLKDFLTDIPPSTCNAPLSRLVVSVLF